MKKLYVGNLPFQATEEQVTTLFTQTGVTAANVTLVRDRFSGQPRGFGFVEVNSDEEAERAIQGLNGHDFMGRNIVVNEARPPREGGGGGGGGRPGGWSCGQGAPLLPAFHAGLFTTHTARAIVNIGGLSAHTGARNRAHVVTAKAGIVGFTRALAHDLAADGITVNCVVPGLIGTPRPKDKPEPAHHLTHQTIDGERGRPEDVAAAVRFLCGPGARYINGQAIHANGGAYLGS